MVGYTIDVMLKPQDVFVLLKVSLLEDQSWSYSSLANALFMSASEVHAGVKRAEAARLMGLEQKKLWRHNLAEFLIHGVKYAYPPERGGVTRGVPTASAAPPLCLRLSNPPNPPPVWPDAEGQVRGYEFSPLYATAVRAAAQDVRLYEMLTLVDAIRDGGARETELAVAELRARLKV